MSRSSFAAVPLTLLLLWGCAPTPGSVASSGGPLGGLTFHPVSTTSAQLVAGATTNTPHDAAGTTTGASGAPMAPGAAPMPSGPGMPSRTGGAYSGNPNGYYGWGWDFGGGGDKALVSFEEADAPGATGEFPAIARTVVAPILAAWSTDARLVQAGAQLRADGTTLAGTAGGDGKLVAPMAGGGNDAGAWRLVYVSSEKSEVLFFWIRPDKTTVLRQRFAPLSMPLDRIAVGSAAAIQRLTAAIEDAGAKSEEERTGRDYFMGFTFTATPMWQDPNQQTEIVYDVPADVRWDASLQQIMGKIVWQLSFYAQDGGGSAVGSGTAGGTAVATPAQPPTATMPAPDARPSIDCSQPPTPSTYFNNSASGMVDAESGTVIRFSRPTRNTYTPPANPGCGTAKPTPDVPKAFRAR